MAAEKQEIDKVMSDFFLLMQQLPGYEKEEDKIDFINQHLEVFEKASKVIKYLIDHGEFKMLYQPLVNKDGHWVAAEALFRMDYEGQSIYPDVVFILAKRFGYEEELTLRVLDKVCKNVHLMKQETQPEFYVTYNINPKLINRDFCMQIFETLYENNVAPSSIGIELLEVSSFDEIKMKDIRNLKNWGFKILIDDFGSGYADEAALAKIHFDIIKFSEKVITDIDKPENEHNRQRVKDVMAFCRRHRISSVAEHVETDEELAVVRELGIEKVQGWYYSKALTMAVFLQKYQSHHA